MKLDLNEIKRSMYKSNEQNSALCNSKTLYNTREKVNNIFYDIFYVLRWYLKLNKKWCKVLASKQMLQ